MRTLCHRVNNSGGIRKWSKDLGGGDEGVIKGGIQRADADGFGTNGCLKVTDCGRLPGGSTARAEMRGEREHLVRQEAGCANAPVQPPTGFHPLLPAALLPPFATNLWSLFGSFRPCFAPISCLLSPSGLQELAEVGALSWKMGKQGSLHQEQHSESTTN